MQLTLKTKMINASLIYRTESAYYRTGDFYRFSRPVFYVGVLFSFKEELAHFFDQSGNAECQWICVGHEL